MRAGFATAVLAAASVVAQAHPHRYVDQQALLYVGLETVDVTIRIVPSFVEGTAIFDRIDSDGNGLVSEDEAAAFGMEILSKTRLDIDGQSIPWSSVAANVPARHLIAAGSGMIEVELSAPSSLTGGENHVIDFQVAYDNLSHVWFLQPYYYEGLVEATSSRIVERTDDAHRIRIRFGSTVP